MSLKSDSETNTSVSLEEEVREINSFSKHKTSFGEVEASPGGWLVETFICFGVLAALNALFAAVWGEAFPEEKFERNAESVDD